MRILAVAEVLDLDEVEHQVFGEIRFSFSEPVGDGRVVMGGR